MSAPKGGNRLQKKSSGQKHWTLILFMVPGLVYLLINNYIPMAGIMLAFKKVNYTLGIFKSPWCGLSNFKYLFKTKDAAIIFRNTVLYNLAFIVLGTAAAVATAILLGEVKKKKLLKIYQTSILLPHILSTAVIAYLAFAFLSNHQASGRRCHQLVFQAQILALYSDVYPALAQRGLYHHYVLRYPGGH